MHFLFVLRSGAAAHQRGTTTRHTTHTTSQDIRRTTSRSELRHLAGTEGARIVTMNSKACTCTTEEATRTHSSTNKPAFISSASVVWTLGTGTEFQLKFRIVLRLHEDQPPHSLRTIGSSIPTALHTTQAKPTQNHVRLVGLKLVQGRTASELPSAEFGSASRRIIENSR